MQLATEDAGVDQDVVQIQSLEAEIFQLRSEYAYVLSTNSELKINQEKLLIAQRRKTRILVYYDHYNYWYERHEHLLHDHACEPSLQLQIHKEIDEDYKHILASLLNEEVKKLEREEMLITAYDDEEDEYDASTGNAFATPACERGTSSYASEELDHPTEHEIEGQNDALSSKPPPLPPHLTAFASSKSSQRRTSVEYRNQSSVLYAVDPVEERTEKQWMAQLKHRKFMIHMNGEKFHQLQLQRIELERRIQEFKTQNEIEQKLKTLCGLRQDIHGCIQERMQYVQHVNVELNSMRNAIAKLMQKRVQRIHSKAVSK